VTDRSRLNSNKGIKIVQGHPITAAVFKITAGDARVAIQDDGVGFPTDPTRTSRRSDAL
jgi:nitrate/nitrite-specific signal transduction histidine kinase